METVYYNFYAFEEAKVSGGEDHRAVLVRECAPRRRVSQGNNVISLEDYRARQAVREAEKQPQDSWDESEFSEGVSAEQSGPRDRSRRRERLLAGLELAACGAIIAVAAAACVVFLL